MSCSLANAESEWIFAIALIFWQDLLNLICVRCCQTFQLTLLSSWNTIRFILDTWFVFVFFNFMTQNSFIGFMKNSYQLKCVLINGAKHFRSRLCRIVQRFFKSLEINKPCLDEFLFPASLLIRHELVVLSHNK